MNYPSDHLEKILIIQTAFIGDVILATPLIENLHEQYPESKIDFLLRKGNEELLKNNPKLNEVLIWDKHKNKYKNLLRIVFMVHKNKYDLVINVHRFGTSGLITMLSGSKSKVGFDKNPFSFSYNTKVNHLIPDGGHETERNLKLLEHIGSNNLKRPKLYFSDDDLRKVQELAQSPYVTLAPASVWFTKQLPKENWIKLIQNIDESHQICLIGGGNDIKLCEEIIQESGRPNIMNLAGKLTMLESAALMSGSAMNYVNDSAPLHISSSVNAPTTAFFCSTIPDFGFGPLSDDSTVVQTSEQLDCRPCGLHGKTACPEGHFKCGFQIQMPELKAP